MIALKGTAGAEATSLDDLKSLRLGAQTGTTSLTAIRDVIQPDTDPLVFEDTNAAKQALQNDQVDAILADLPTAFYITAVEIPDSDDRRAVPAGDRRAGGVRHALREGQRRWSRASTRRWPRCERTARSTTLEQQWLSDVVDVPEPPVSDSRRARCRLVADWSPSEVERARRRGADVGAAARDAATTAVVVFFVVVGWSSSARPAGRP